jgi:hypothetical protein
MVGRLFPLRKLNEMFHVDDEGYLVKTSNNQRVPEDEPIFILRGRDNQAVQTLKLYHSFFTAMNGDPDRLKAIEAVVEAFMKFKLEHPERMKQPGSTRGA